MWVPIAADVSGKPLLLGDLRVKYLMLGAGAYNIIDRTNRVADSGHYIQRDQPEAVVEAARQLAGCATTPRP